MIQQHYKVLGVMSGTSLDGIDLAEIDFEFDPEKGWSYHIGKAATVPYNTEWKHILGEAVDSSEEQLEQLNNSYTRFLGGLIRDFIVKWNISPLDAVCSHGHTILHRPDQGITLQIGNLAELAAICRETVVCDFRVQDVQLGGQGAPLVPIGDSLLFSDYDYCLNLGGFANVSFERAGERVAYDICPVNIVLNALAEKIGKPYDEDGQVAEAANVNPELLLNLNRLEYYQAAPPKSLGLEWVKDNIWPLLNASEISIEDKIATFTEHAAMQLAVNFDPGKSVLVTGGGANNKYLLSRIQHHNSIVLEVPDVKIVEYKEALIFGLLGVLKLRGEVNCLSSVTGASKDHSSGIIFKPSKL